jgi:hypothetical protein
MFIGWHIDKEITTFWNLENDEDVVNVNTKLGQYIGAKLGHS